MTYRVITYDIKNDEREREHQHTRDCSTKTKRVHVITPNILVEA